MAKVVWSDRAVSDVENIKAYIAQFNPSAADRMAGRLVAAALQLESVPAIGRATTRGRRELAIVTPYLIRYRITGDRVTILEVRHGARRPD